MALLYAEAYETLTYWEYQWNKEIPRDFLGQLETLGQLSGNGPTVYKMYRWSTFFFSKQRHPC